MFVCDKTCKDPHQSHVTGFDSPFVFGISGLNASHMTSSCTDRILLIRVGAKENYLAPKLT